MWAVEKAGSISPAEYRQSGIGQSIDCITVPDIDPKQHEQVLLFCHNISYCLYLK